MGRVNKKKILKITVVIVGTVVLLAALFFGWLTLTEYRPAETESLEIQPGKTGLAAKRPAIGGSIKLMTWNVGYCAIGDNADFFLDGGKQVNTADELSLRDNMLRITEDIKEEYPDVLFLQEIDIDSSRSHGINETEYFLDELSGDRSLCASFAYNFKVKFIPYPLPPIGRVNSGLFTVTGFDVSDASRISLPCPFKWPVRTANLKRCLLVNRVPVTDAAGNDTGRELVLVNLHLEAFDSGEGKIEQTKKLKTFMQNEAEKGNYVIAGGDFNQTFSNADASAYPLLQGKWHPGSIDVGEFGEEFTCVSDNSFPTARSLDRPYVNADKESFQYYLVDGYIVSANIGIDSIAVLDKGFKNSDHNPVVMEVTLKEPS